MAKPPKPPKPPGPPKGPKKPAKKGATTVTRLPTRAPRKAPREATEAPAEASAKRIERARERLATVTRLPPRAPAPLSRNELRTLTFVAAHGVVGRSVLEALQQALPAGDWGACEAELAERGWVAMRPLLAWDTAPLAEVREVTLRELVEGLAREAGASGEWGRDACRLLFRHEAKDERAALGALLDQTLPLRRTELGVRLGLRRGRATQRAYEEALAVLHEEGERLGWQGLLDVQAAARGLRAALHELRLQVVYEALDPALVARAVLARRGSVKLRQERFAVVFSPFDETRAHRLFVLSRLGRDELSEALGLAPETLQRAGDQSLALAARRAAAEPDPTGLRGPAPQAFDEAEADLRRAAGLAR
jgi:hypothetical protein